MTSAYTFLFKFIIIGESGVGKSCLLIQATDKRFAPNQEATIGVEFGSVLLRIPPSATAGGAEAPGAAVSPTSSSTVIKCQIWDTAGQDKFRSITRSYYRGAVGALIVYDVTQRYTFDSIATWLKDAREYTNACIILVGNKAETDAERQVSTEEGRAFADENGLLFLECSAMTGLGVSESFHQLARAVMERAGLEGIVRRGHISDDETRRLEELGIKPGPLLTLSAAARSAQGASSINVDASDPPSAGGSSSCC